MASPLHRLTQNWQLKLAAFALAVLLWIVVSADQVTTQWLPVAIDVDLRDPGMRLVEGPIPNEVEVRFAGPGRDLWEIAVNRPRLLLRVTDAGDNQVFLLDPRMVRIPAGLQAAAQDVRPSSVRLRFVPLGSREVPVRIQVSAPPREGLVLLDSLVVEPRYVSISGPAARVAEVREVLTRPIDLSHETGAFARSLALDTAGLGGVSLAVSEVHVSGTVEPIVLRTVNGVPIAVPPGSVASPATAAVQLRGPESVVARLGASNLRVAVPGGIAPADLPAAGALVRVHVDAPASVAATVSPASIRLLPATTLEVPAVPDSAREVGLPRERG
jgi:hypothetical protein